MAILSFKDPSTERFFRDGRSPKAGWAAIVKSAARKLDMLNSASALKDLASPPGNRLEALRGERADQWSIRVNDQLRLCFKWSELGLIDVEIVDYH